MSNSQTQADNPKLYLEIVTGATKFPNRPVYEGVFLIGSGSNCDLRLGGTATPTVHSVIRAEDGEVHIESLSRKPLLRVNGNPCERTELSDGDRIQIGSIQMIAKFQLAAAAPAMVVTPEPAESDISNMSTPELIELLEQDLALVEEHEASQAAGAELLLNAARHAAAVPEVEEEEHGLSIVDPDADEDLRDDHAEAEQLIVALNRIADDLNTRVDHMRKNEEVYSDAAEDLLTMQNRFATLLERVLERLDRRDEQRPHRRSA